MTTQFTYTAQGLVDLVTDALGRITDYDYNLLGRVIQVTYANGTTDQGVQQFEYDTAGNITAFIDENNHRTEFAYDPMNLLMLTRDALLHETSFVYDDAGNLIRTTDARTNQTAYAYDVFNRRISMTDANNGITKFAYDVDNNLVSVTDPLNHQTTYEYDLRDRLVSTIDAIGGTTRFGYDANNNLTSLIDPVGNATFFAYDARDRMVSEIDPLGKSTRYQYDSVNNLIGTIDRNGEAIAYAYDDLDRLLTETWVGGGNVVSSQYDKVGNLTSILDQFSKLTFTYDNRDRVSTVDNQGTPDAPRVALSYVYDGAGNILAVNDAINGTAAGTNAYTYDALNRTTRVTQSGAGVTDKLVDFTYNEVSQFVSVTRFSDLVAGQVVATTNYVYDALNRITNMTHKNAASSVLNQFDLQYDPASRITKITDIDGATDYNYDVTDQLTGATHADPGNPDETYQYDENGNRVASSLHGTGYVTGPGNRLQSDGTYAYVYDGKGSLIRRTEIATSKVREFNWDQRGRLVEIDDLSGVGQAATQIVKYTYDALDRRIAKSVDTDGVGAGLSKESLFVYDRDNVAFEFIDVDGAAGPASASLDRRNLHGPAVDQILAQQDAAGNVFWLLTDYMGTVRDVVNNGGAVMNHLIYDSYGNVLSQTDPSIQMRYGFTGREFDRETGTYYYWARQFDPQSGRFLSEDPASELISVNPFSYALNAPTKFIDPNGRTPLITGAIGAGIGAVVGGVVEWNRGGSWGDIGLGAARGAIAGGVTGLTLGFGGATIAGWFGGGWLGGAAAGAVGGAAGNAAAQTFNQATGSQCGFDWGQLGFSAGTGAIFGGLAIRPYTGPNQQVSTWAPGGVQPTLDPGRWVMTGGSGAGNYLRTVGPVLRGYPYSNNVSASVPGSSLSYPSGGTGNLAGLLGQRIYNP